MKRTHFPYLTDWLAISLRWFVLFGLTVSLGIGRRLVTNENQPNLLLIFALCLPVLWNGFMSVLAIYNRRMIFHRYINVILDSVFSILLFVIADGLQGEIAWVALLPVVSAAALFEARGALPVAIFISLLQSGTTFLGDGEHFQPVMAGVVTGFNLTAGMAFALLSAPLVGSLRQIYQRTVSREKENEQKVQTQERDRLKSLFEMIETLSATLNYQTVLETLLQTSETALGDNTPEAPQMVGAVLLFGSQNKLEIHASRGFVPHDQGVSLPVEAGALNEALNTGETCVVLKPAEDPELSQLVTLQGQGVALCLPLIRSMNAYGVILFAHPDRVFFNVDRVDTLQMLANQAIISIQNARLYQDLASENKRIMQTQEEAQKKLARNLHDGPTQSVSAIAMRLSIARKMLENPQSTAETVKELEKIEELARRTTQEIRHMLFTLRPLVLENEGLIPALTTMAEKMKDTFQQNVIVDAAQEVVVQMDAAQQSTTFFLAEEAVNNARKHSRASAIWVRLRMVANQECMAVLEIIDNGVGFDVDSVMNSYDRRGSLGMINLRERADLIKGILKIDSVQGKGTRVQIFIPLSESSADQLCRLRAPL